MICFRVFHFRSTTWSFLFLHQLSLTLHNKILSLYTMSEINSSFRSWKYSEGGRWRGGMTSWLDSAGKAHVWKHCRSAFTQVVLSVANLNKWHSISAVLPDTIKFSPSCVSLYEAWRKKWWEGKQKPVFLILFYSVSGIQWHYRSDNCICEWSGLWTALSAGTVHQDHVRLDRWSMWSHDHILNSHLRNILWNNNKKKP